MNATWWGLPYAVTATGVHHRVRCVVAFPDRLEFGFQCGGRSFGATLVWRPEANARHCQLCPVRGAPHWSGPYLWDADE